MGIWTAFDSSPPRSTTTKRCVLLPENPNTVVSSSIYDRARCLPSHMYSFLTWYNNRRRFDDIHASTWEMVARIFDTQLDRCQVEYSSPDTSYCGSNEPSQISLVKYVMKEWQEPKWGKWAPPLSPTMGIRDTLHLQILFELGQLRVSVQILWLHFEPSEALLLTVWYK